MTPPLKFATVVEALYFEAKESAPSRRIRFIDDEGGEEALGYLQALDEARGRAAALARAGVEPGERVPLIAPTSQDFMHLFFGIQLAGAIPVPLAPPASFGDLEDFVRRTERVATYLGARRVVTVGAMRDVLVEGLPAAKVLLAESLRADALDQGPAFTPPPIAASDVAMIQCTSGSTGLPKGVELTHENLISNVHQIGFSLGVKPGDVPVCWLPLYHDMGLIGCLLFATYWNLDSVFLSPARFLRRPASWLQAISRHRGSISPAPNFAYSYVTSRAREQDLDGLDLSSFRIALCGAEPVDPRTLQKFQERFARYGLPENCATPCYGLAEATLGVTFHPIGAPLAWDCVARDALAERGEVVDVPEGKGQLVACCGPPMAEVQVRIVDDDGQTLPEDRAGHVQVRGPTVMRGYYDRPEETAATLVDGWLRTGDMGYLRGGALRLTGRSKDLVIIRGRNYAPSDFEWAAEEVAGVRRGNVVALGLTDPAQGTEALHLVCETDVEGDAEREALVQAIRAHVAQRTDVVPAQVELVPRNSIPKTSSGKLQRGKMRERYVASLAFRGFSGS